MNLSFQCMLNKLWMKDLEMEGAMIRRMIFAGFGMFFSFLMLAGCSALGPDGSTSARDRQSSAQSRQSSAQNRPVGKTAQPPSSVSSPERRTALVIGNGEYKTAPLKNPPNDAKAISKVLRDLGFDVTEKINITRSEMRSSIESFGLKLRSGSVGLFYYSGHGMQVNGNNYMIPVDAKIQTEQDAEDDGVNVNRVLGKMEASRSGINIVILDACRNNPYKRSFRGDIQGLAYMNAPRGTIIAYATAPGTVASDGIGDNSPYTGELVKALQTPGLKIEDVFKRVRGSLLDSAGGNQVPWEAGCLVGDFYFTGPPAAVSQVPPPTQVAGGQMLSEKPQPETPKTGSLKIRSNVNGAAVYIDDKAKGTVPISMSDLSVGTVRVRVSQKGYESQEKSIRIQAGKETDISFLLDPEPLQVPPAPVSTTPSIPPASVPAVVPVAVVPAAVVPPPVVPAASAPPVPAPSATIPAPVSGVTGEGWREPVTGMDFVRVPAGCYQMGCGSWTSDCFEDEKPVHEVCLEGFWIGKYEVTQGQWALVMGSNPSLFRKGDNYPVENVSWNDAKEFISKLNSMGGGRYELGLPSEAQWEYAARSGGKSEKFSGGAGVDAVAWYESNSGSSTHPIGTKSANRLGIYDMSGNVWEWCEDAFDSSAYQKHQRSNPVYSGGSKRVRRGGSWGVGAKYARCARRGNGGPADRYDRDPAYRYGYLGFRLVRTR